MRQSRPHCLAALQIALVPVLVVAGLANVRVAAAAAPAACSLPHRLVVVGGARALAVDAEAHLLIVAAQSTLVLLDSCTGKLVTRVSAGGAATQVAVDAAAGRALVVVASRVRLFDTRHRRWLADARLPADARPRQMAIAGETHEALLVDPGYAALWVVDTRTGAVVHHVGGLRGTLDAVALDAGRHRAFVASASTSSVGVIDCVRWRLLRWTGVGRWPLALAVSVRAGRVFVANRDSGTVSVLDSASGRLLQTVALQLTPRAVAVDERRQRAYIATQGAGAGAEGQLVVADVNTGKLLGRLRERPSGAALAVDAQTGTILCLEQGTGAIEVVVAGTMAGPAAQPTATYRASATNSATPRSTASATATPRPTVTVTLSPTRTAAPTMSVTPQSTPTATPTALPTYTPVPTNTPLPTYTPPPTPSPTASLLPTPTVTGTPTPTVTATPVPLSAAQLVGNWNNVLAYTPSVPQVTILANADGSYAVHGYGSCSPTYCDWGVTPLIVVPGSATAVAQFDNGNTLVLSLSGNELRVDDHRTSGPVTTDYLVRA